MLYNGDSEKVAEANIATRKLHTYNNAIDAENNRINMICDSGATEHLVNSTSCLSNLVNIKNPIQIHGANVRASLEATKLGTKTTRLDNGKIVKIKNILFASRLSKNLLILRKLVQNGVRFLTRSQADWVKNLNASVRRPSIKGSFDGQKPAFRFLTQPSSDYTSVSRTGFF